LVLDKVWGTKDEKEIEIYKNAVKKHQGVSLVTGPA
jgi:hypothetical protein